MAHDMTCACGKKLRAATALRGRQGRCPACRRVLIVPSGDTAIQCTRLARIEPLQSLEAQVPIESHSIGSVNFAGPELLLQPAPPLNSQGGSVLAACLGGTLVSCIIIAVHYASLDCWTELWTAVAFALLASAGLILMLRRTPGQAGEVSWKTIRFGLVAGLCCLCLAVTCVWAWEELVGDTGANKLVLRGGDQVYFDKDATKAEAKRLGQFLQDDGYFDRPSASSVELIRQGYHVIVSFVVPRDAWNDPLLVASYRSMGDDISMRLFGGRSVQVRLCDQEWKVRQTIN